MPPVVDVVFTHASMLYVERGVAVDTVPAVLVEYVGATSVAGGT
jgi:hypothetical protein